jgi:hypothetical protein
MWRFLVFLLIALPAVAQDLQPLLGPGTLPPREPAAITGPSAVEALPEPAIETGKTPEPLPTQAPPMPGAPLAVAPLPATPLPATPDPARCGPAREGQVACMAGRLCACRFERGGQLTGRGEHFAWDCGTLRPACDQPPADLPGAAHPDIQVFPQVTLPRRR